MLSKTFLAKAAQSVFNSSEWKPFGQKYTLEEVCDSGVLGFDYSDIVGEAEVTETSFDDGNSAIRITVTLKDGQKPQLKAGKAIQNGYDEGDTLDVSLIYGQELRKAGQEPIIRYDVWESEEQKEKDLKERDSKE